MTDAEIMAMPWAALAMNANTMTQTQFDYCVVSCPKQALLFGRSRLTQEQLIYCKEKTKWEN